MRILKILLILLISNSQILIGQEVEYISEPILIENKTIEELSNDSEIKLIEELRYEGQLFYLKVQRIKDTLEFLKANDTIFYFREINDTLINEGYYKINSKSNRIDSVFFFHPETYEEALKIISYHQIEKHGLWEETNSNNISWQGKYLNGRKIGRWFKSIDKINFYKKSEYENGKLKLLYNPNIENLKDKLNWIIDKPFTFCTISYYTDDQNNDIELWSLNTEQTNDCSSFGEFFFQNTGEFEYKHNSKNKMNIQKYNGKGMWKINDEGKLELKFQNNEKSFFKVDQLSQREMQIRKLKR